MGRGGSRGVALGLAVAVVLGASAGMLLSKMSVEARADALPVALPLNLSSPEQRERIAARAAEVAGATATRPAKPRPSKEACGPSDGRLVRWRVEVGPAMDVTPRAFALAVQEILCDERGWTGAGVRFRYTGQADRVVSLRSAAATERRCLAMIGLSVRHTWSCAGTNEAVLNADRWFEGSPTLDLSVRRYRQLLVNHEVGHLLGYRHRSCPAAGARAPVMMQQSKGLGGCRANGWPRGADL